MRSSGILFPVTSLPSEYGIGCFSKSAYDFVDFLHKSGQSYWQILPLGPTGYGDSPYQSFSTFAGNPYFIDLKDLIKRGWLDKTDCDKADFGTDPVYIDYHKIYLSRFIILKVAFEKSRIKSNKKFRDFVKRNSFWLDDYALFMAIKDSFNGLSFLEWDDEIKLRDKARMEKCRKDLKKEVDFYCFLQFLFFEQWTKLKRYANAKGIKIIGDIPIYVSQDSSDAWSKPELFQFDKNLMPLAVAGCPPDGFSATGQLWGNPLYRWDYHRETGYKWWIERLKYCFLLYDVVRIDHFRGFDAYFSIPYNKQDARCGKWKRGPGYEIIKVIKRELGDCEIIAEDLGFLTPGVLKLVKRSGYPGMKILQFAFDSREESDYLPHNYHNNCIVYTGTHDNDTILGWYENLESADKSFCRNYLNLKNIKKKELNFAFIRAAMASVAYLSIIPLQDYLGLGSEARINIPSTVGDNWRWRLTGEELNEELAAKIKEITTLYRRANTAK